MHHIQGSRTDDDVARALQASMDKALPVEVEVVDVGDVVGGGGVLTGVGVDVLTGGLLVGDGDPAQAKTVFCLGRAGARTTMHWCRFHNSS